LVATVIHIQSLHSQIYVYEYIVTHSSQYRDSGRAEEIKKIETAVNAACRFGHGCRKFASPQVDHYPVLVIGRRAGQHGE
jgi:hypothetical protein